MNVPHGQALAWLRRVGALAVLVGGLVVLTGGRPKVCDQQQSQFGDVATVCRAPRADDPFVLAGALLFLVLLSPELAEFGVPGLLTVKFRLRRQEQRSELTDSALEGLRVQLAELHASSTSTAAANQSTVVNLALAQADGLRAAQFAGSGTSDTGWGHGQSVAEARFITAERALDAFVREASSELSGAQVHVYMPNAGSVLVPMDEPERSADEAGWPPSFGVVGRVWSTGDRLTLSGADLEPDLVVLPADRADRYGCLARVTAVPVANDSGRVIAVMSAAWQRPPPSLDSESVFDVLRLNAVMCARVIVDLFGWDDDGPGHGETGS